MTDSPRYVDEAINRFAAEEDGATALEWFLIVYVENRDGSNEYVRLSPSGQRPHSTGGLIQHAAIRHEERVRGMGQ